MITQLDLEHAYSAKTVDAWVKDADDRVGVIAAAIEDAESEVATTLEPAFPGVFPLTAGNEPTVLKGVVVAFAAYTLAGRRQKRTDTVTENREKGEKTLAYLLKKGSVLRFPDGSTAVSVGIDDDDETPAAGPSGFFSSTLNTTRVFTDESFAGFV